MLVLCPHCFILGIHFICTTLGPKLDVVVKRDVLGFVDIYSKTFYVMFSVYYLASVFSATLSLLSFQQMQLMYGVGTTGHNARLEWSSSAIVSTALLCAYRQCM